MKALLLLLLPIAVHAAELNELNYDRLHGFADAVPEAKQLAEKCYAEVGKNARLSPSCAKFRSKFLTLHDLKTQTDRINKNVRYSAIAQSNKLYEAFKTWDYINVLAKNKEQMRGYYK